MPAIRNTRSTPSASAGPSQDPARPAKAQGKSTVDDKYDKGDFTITCVEAGEETVFRLPSFYMLAASSVIRDTSEIGTEGDKFELDLDERASVVRLWLDLITGDESAQLDWSYSKRVRMRELLDLCQRFDCSTARKIITTSLELAFDYRGAAAVDCIATAAMYGACLPVEKGIRTHGDRTKCVTEDVIEDLNAVQPFDIVRNPVNWSLEDFCLLPPAYCWAILRSYSQTKTRGEQADRLKVLLKLIEDQGKPEPLEKTTEDTDAAEPEA